MSSNDQAPCRPAWAILRARRSAWEGSWALRSRSGKEGGGILAMAVLSETASASRLGQFVAGYFVLPESRRPVPLLAVRPDRLRLPDVIVPSACLRVSG